MNFDWTENEQKLRDAVAALFDDDTTATLDSLETAEAPAIRGALLDLLGKLAASDTGYLSLGLGDGGQAETLKLMAGQEVLAERSGALLLGVEVTVRLFGGLLAAYGSEQHRIEILEPLRAGTLLGALAVADGASDGAGGVIATRHGDGVQLSGTKAFVTNGPIADWIAVLANLDGRQALCLVPGDAAGLSRGARLETLGYRGLAVCPLTFDDVQVGEIHVIGPFDGPEVLAGLRRTEDLILILASVGLQHRMFEASKAHAIAHQRGGKPLMGYQEIRFKLAEMLTLYQTSQLYAYRAAWLVSDVDGPDAYDADTVVRAAKVFTAESAERVATAAMQILAGQGYVSGNSVERGYRDAKYAGLAGTTIEVCRMAIADEMLERNPV